MQKKGLSAFIKKQQTKKGKKLTTEEPAATTSEQKKAQDIETDAKKDQVEKNTTSQAEKKEESSDEEEDELDIAKKQINLNKIVEKEITSSNAKAGDQDKKIGYGFEDQSKEDEKAEEKDKKPAKKTGGGSINFTGGKPTFGNRNKNVAGRKIMNDAFSAGLEDLDEDESNKKDKKGGQKESAPVKEETKEASKVTGVKPTFKGRMNLRGGGGPNEGDAGVVKDYSFNVTFKSEAGGERKQNNDRQGQVDRKDRRQQRDKGMSLNAFNQQQQNENDEDGFTIVGRETRKKAKKDDSSSDDDDEPARGFKRNPAENVRGARVERGGNRGGRGGK